MAVIAALVAFVVYVLTAARTATWLHSGADSGELTTAAFTLGIPHPPGYPLYTMIAAGFARLPIGEPAFGVALLSALAGAGAVFMLARAGSALLENFDVSGDANLSKANATNTPFAVEFIPPLAALAFGFAPLFWSQATIPEVYTLNLFFVSVILWACVTNSRLRVYIAALAFGLGMAHHLLIVLMLPGAFIALQPKWRDARAIVLLLAPLLFYSYLPLTALGNPPVNWGDPVTPERFLWLVTAAQYRPYLFGVDEPEAFSRFAFAARSLLDQFTLVGLALLLWGVIQLALERTRLAVALIVMFVPFVAYSIVYASRDSFLYLLPAFAIALLWLVYGAAHVVKWFSGDRLLQGAAVGLFALLPIFNLVTNYAAMDVSNDRTAFDYAHQNLASLPTDTVLFADGDESLFALLYYRHTIDYVRERSLIVSQGLLDYPWYYDNLRRIMSEVQFQPSTVVTDAHARAR